MRDIPPKVIGELLLEVVLGYRPCDLRRPLLPLVCCSDDSTTFGFGASVCKAPIRTVQELTRIACKHGAFSSLDDGEAVADYAERLGTLCSADLAKKDFTHVFSIKSWSADHISILEGEALCLLVRWILRSRFRHCARVVAMLDSKVVLGVAAKGRSSSRLSFVLRRLAALELAGELMLYFILVPSAENPSDVLSCGLRPRELHELLIAQS